MVITAIIDRIEDGHAILLSDEIGIEISIPADRVKGVYNQGELLSLTIDKSGNINMSDSEVINE